MDPRLAVNEARELMSMHRCEICLQFVSIMSMMEPLLSTSKAGVSVTRLLSTRSRKKSFLEAGCTVCGRSTPQVELIALTEFQGNLGLLKGEGVTRKERFSSADPIVELDGLILAEFVEKSGAL
jgi:hypothetical protein